MYQAVQEKNSQSKGGYPNCRKHHPYPKGNSAKIWPFFGLELFRLNGRVCVGKLLEGSYDLLDEVLFVGGGELSILDEMFLEMVKLIDTFLWSHFYKIDIWSD